MKFFLISLIFLLLGTGVAHAASYELSGKVLDGQKNPVTNAVISVSDKTGQMSKTVTTDNSGAYFMEIPQGTYDISVKGPAGSNFPQVTTTDQTILGNSSKNFTLTKHEITKAPAIAKATPLSYFVVFIIVAVILSLVFFFIKKRKKSVISTGSL